MPDRPDALDFESQDSAEALDETVLDENEGMGEMRTFEELPELFDVTRANGDRDDDEGLAVDAADFDEDAIDDSDTDDDDELDYRAATHEREDDIDGLGAEDGFDEDAMDLASSIEGLDEEVADAGLVSGGEDDISNFQARNLSDEDLQRMGYSENRKGVTLAKPDG
jgi:hypothetical protein